MKIKNEFSTDNIPIRIEFHENDGFYVTGEQCTNTKALKWFYIRRKFEVKEFFFKLWNGLKKIVGAPMKEWKYCKDLGIIRMPLYKNEQVYDLVNTNKGLVFKKKKKSFNYQENIGIFVSMETKK